MKQIFLLLALTIGLASQSYASLSSSTAVSETKRVYKYAQQNKLKKFIKSLDGDALLKYGSQEGMQTIASENDNYKKLEFTTTLISSQKDPNSMFPIEIFNVAVYADQLTTIPIRTAQARCNTRFHMGGGCMPSGVCGGSYYDSSCVIIGLDEKQ